MEKRELHHFLDSPYFNRREEVTRLWHYLVAQSTEDEAAWQKENIHAHLFPGEAFDDSRVRYALSFLRERIEWFLAYRNFIANPANHGLHLMTEYRGRQLEKHFRHSERKAEKALGKMPLGTERQIAEYRMERERYEFAEGQKQARESKLQNLHDAFDKFILSEKLRQACLMANHQSVEKMEYDFSFLPLLVEWLSGQPILAEPEVAIYYHCYRALTETDEAHFKNFRRELESHGHLFARNEARDILLLSVNYSIRQLNAGHRKFVQETFDLYRLGLQSDLLTERGVMTRFTYKNIVALGLGLQQFEWVEKFIHEWKDALEERFRESSFHFNLAKLHFSTGKYEAAMPLLAQVGDSDFLLMLDAKVLLLKMYFEREEWEPLDSLLASFKSFLRRKTKLGYHKVHYRSLVRYTEKIISLKIGDREGREKLRREIESDPAVLERGWLLSRIEI